VERSVNGQKASLSWWVNDSMTDADRIKQKLDPPDLESWNQQMLAAEVFHQLICDADANRTNLLITKGWQIWMIDSTRAFRTNKNLQEPKNLVRCDRKLLAKIRTLDKDVLKDKLSRWLTGLEIDGLAARAHKMAELFDKQTAAKAEAVVLYDFPRTSQPCGTGL
jgi:DNA-binding FadR family transcriptional regulator